MRTSYLIIATMFTSMLSALSIADASAATQKSDSFAAAAEASMGASPVNDNVLGESRGAFTPDLFNINSASFTANSSGNTVNGGVTGNNTISSGSFSNAQGLVNIIQNTGNNVIIQSSTIVSMTMIGQ